MDVAPSPVRNDAVALTKRPWRVLRALLLFVVTPYVAVTVIFVVMQRQFIYVPTKTGRLWAEDVATPAIPVDDLEIHAANGLTLHGWRFRAPDSVKERPWLLIYFPGNAGCRADRVAECREFTRLGCDVVLFDYRGYGDNPGAPGEAVMAADARRVWMLVTHELEYPRERILLFGESIGGAVATRLAAEFSLAGDPPAAIILNSTFASLPRTVAWHYPVFPFHLLVRDQYPSLDRIPQVTAAVLQFHCTADGIVPLKEARVLFDAAPSQSAAGVDKRFVEIAGGGHNFISAGMMATEIRSLMAALSQP